MTAPFIIPDARLRVDGGRIYVNALVAHQALLKSVPGAQWDPATRAWTYPATPTTASELLAAFVGLEIRADDEVRALAGAGVERAKVIRAKEDILLSELPEVPWAKLPLWAHQRACFWYAAQLLDIADPATPRYVHEQPPGRPDQGGAGIFMEMGTGKSAVAISLAQAAGARMTLVVCPNSVVGVWPRQFREHGALAWNVVALRGKKGGAIPTKDKKDLAHAAAQTSGALGLPLVLIVNYESAWLDPLAKWLLAQDWDMLILDESHRIKSPGSRVSMFMATLARRARRRLALTGTPLPHSPLDIYGQYRATDPSIFGTSYARFRDRYADMNPVLHNKVQAWKNQAELTDKIYGIAYRVTKEVLDLPEQIHLRRYCALEPGCRRVYDEMARDMVAEVEGGTMTAANALVRLLRLQQVASGYATIPGEDGEKELVEVGKAKRDLLADVLDDLPAGEPTVVFAVFRKDLDNIRAVCAEKGLAYGELSGRDKGGLTVDSTMAPGIDVLGVQLRSGGVGIDLTRASTAIYYSMGFSLGDYDQSRSRLHRPGQMRTVRYVHLLAEDTVDLRVYNALKERKEVIDTVLGDISGALFGEENDDD
jgi:SNF2 family DNA or RNA helicase